MMKMNTMIEINRIYQYDCMTFTKMLDTESIDLIVTSPPYKDKDGYDINYLTGLFKELHRVAKSESLFFLNFGHLAEDKFRPFQTCDAAIRGGWKLNDTITWVKNHYSPIRGTKHLNNLTEFIFILYKDKMPALDRLSIGVPYRDKSNVGRYADKDLKCGGNVWHINYETISNKDDKLHPDRFPPELPARCIKLSGIKQGSIVFDPFAGSGTTALSAKNLGMRFVGAEKNINYFEIAKKRLDI